VAVAQLALAAGQRRQDERQRAELASVNGEPALLVRAGGEVRVVLTIDVDHGQVTAIRIVRNPDKLHELNRMLQQIEGAAS
jgi:RNA polymerase sigma-70 factor (ECF subfamily)